MKARPPHVQPMSAAPAVAAPSALLEHRSFVAYWCARTATNGAYQMQAVAVGWQIYELTGSAFDLGLVGLVQFFPVVVLGLLIGQIADRYDRRVVVGTCQVIKALAAAAFAFGTLGGFLTRDAMLAILFVSGTARAFETPTMHTLVPGIVPPALLPRAIAASATASQTAIICGPAIGGLLYVFGAAPSISTCTAVFVLASVLVSLIRLQGPPPEQEAGHARDACSRAFTTSATTRWCSARSRSTCSPCCSAASPRCCRSTPRTCWRPGRGAWACCARRRRSARWRSRSWLAHHQLEHRVGHVLFGVGRGVRRSPPIVFAFSTSLVLSIVALAVYGAADAVSVVIRHSLVQTRTPNDMLGRVMAVNFMFTGTSGTLGEFRAGAVAALFGAFTSVLVGGIGAVAGGAAVDAAVPGDRADRHDRTNEPIAEIAAAARRRSRRGWNRTPAPSADADHEREQHAAGHGDIEPAGMSASQRVQSHRRTRARREQASRRDHNTQDAHGRIWQAVAADVMLAGSTRNDGSTRGQRSARYAFKPSLIGAPCQFSAEAGRAAMADRAAAPAASATSASARVRLSYRPVTMQSHRFITEIWSTDNPKMQIVSVSWRSFMEQERLDAAYMAFVTELHRRLAAAGSDGAVHHRHAGRELLDRRRGVRRGHARHRGDDGARAAARRSGRRRASSRRSLRCSRISSATISAATGRCLSARRVAGTTCCRAETI